MPAMRIACSGRMALINSFMVLYVCYAPARRSETGRGRSPTNVIIPSGRACIRRVGLNAAHGVRRPKLKKAKNAQGKNKHKTRKDKNILNLKKVLRSELKRLARKQKPENEFGLKKDEKRSTWG